MLIVDSVLFHSEMVSARYELKAELLVFLPALEGVWAQYD